MREAKGRRKWKKRKERDDKGRGGRDELACYNLYSWHEIFKVLSSFSAKGCR
jgi:hypothetical protein